jgi:hypothetical protein
MPLGRRESALGQPTNRPTIQTTTGNDIGNNNDNNNCSLIFKYFKFILQKLP